MIQAGQIVLFRFPHTDLGEGKMRPTLIAAKVPGRFDDWLACAISTQLHQQVEGFDEIIRETDADYVHAGLKSESLVRVGRLGVLNGAIFEGAVGEISADSLPYICFCEGDLPEAIPSRGRGLLRREEHPPRRDRIYSYLYGRESAERLKRIKARLVKWLGE